MRFKENQRVVVYGPAASGGQLSGNGASERQAKVVLVCCDFLQVRFLDDRTLGAVHVKQCRPNVKKASKKKGRRK